MPIEVRHVPPAGITALAGLLGGRGRAAISETEFRRRAGLLEAQLDAQQARQTQQLSAQRDAQMRQIAAQADRQREAADTAYARTALAAGLNEKIQEQEFDREMAKMQEVAKIKANQFEYEFTTKDKQQMARIEEAKQYVNASSDFSQDEKEQFNLEAARKLAGFTSQRRVRDPNKVDYPDGPNGQKRGIGDIFRTEDGTLLGRDQNGKPFLIERWEQSKEAAALEVQAKREQAEIDYRTKFMDNVAATRAKIAQTPIATTDREGNEIKRLPDPAEVWARLQIAIPPETWPARGGPATGQQQQEAPVDTTPRALIGWTRNIRFTEEEERLPPMVARARSFLRVTKATGKERNPDRSEAIRQAIVILREHESGGGG